jgi:hypothetical protein
MNVGELLIFDLVITPIINNLPNQVNVYYIIG